VSLPAALPDLARAGIDYSIDRAMKGIVKKRRILCVGVILLLAGVVGFLVSTAGMIGAFRDVSEATSTEDLAHGISGALIPAGIGGLLALLGVILVLLDFFYFRSSRQRQA